MEKMETGTNTATALDLKITGSMNAAAEKAFRQQADIEAFYRFVHENDLRAEALEILQNTWEQKKLDRAMKNKKKH